MTPEEAAAYFILHRDDDMTAADLMLFRSWFAANDEYAQALVRTEAAWRCFLHAEDDEILAKMRADARGARPVRRARLLAMFTAAWFLGRRRRNN